MAGESSLTSAIGAAAPIASIGLGALEAGLNYFAKRKALKEQKALLSQRKAYQTPQEIFDILNATESKAASGFDPTTLAYLTNQTDQAFAGSLGTLNRLGGNPNDAAALFNEKVDSIMKISSQDQELKTQNFSRYLSALGEVAANKAAEQKSQQDIIKDKLQATGVNIQNNDMNIASGLNAIIGGASALGVGSLYNPDGTPKKKNVNGLAWQAVGPGE